MTRKNRQFIWEEEQQNAFEEIKKRFDESPVLHLPDNKGRIYLYSDNCKFPTGSTLYQIQNCKPKLRAYAIKRMSEATKNYFITVLWLGNK